MRVAKAKCKTSAFTALEEPFEATLGGVGSQKTALLLPRPLFTFQIHVYLQSLSYI